jgi:hypothetical protein
VRDASLAWKPVKGRQEDGAAAAAAAAVGDGVLDRRVIETERMLYRNREVFEWWR